MKKLDRETGVIISIDESLNDLVKGFIRTDTGEIIPFYHPNCVRFYIKVGQKVEFSVDDIGGFMVIPPQIIPTYPNVLPPVEYIQTTFRLVIESITPNDKQRFTSLIDGLGNYQQEADQTQCHVDVDELVRMVENSSDREVYLTAKKKVAVDLEPKS